jgi:hypothetical protein
MKEKCLKVRFSNGDMFEIPARVIAENRANYYADLDGYEINSNEWEAEIISALNDEFEIEDWAANNMNWNELAPYARRIDSDKEFDYDDGWTDADIELTDLVEEDF